MQYLIDLQLVREFATLTKELRLAKEGVHPVEGFIHLSAYEKMQVRHRYLAGVHFDLHLQVKCSLIKGSDQCYFEATNEIEPDNDEKWTLLNCGVFLPLIENQSFDNDFGRPVNYGYDWVDMTFDLIFQKYALAMPKTDLILRRFEDENAFPVKLVSNLDQEKYPRIETGYFD